MPTKHEMEFRSFLNRQMNGLWELTWHEDGQVNPGVPDTSYVMHDNCETGWMELKAIEGVDKYGKYKFTLEPSQHRWIEQHYSRVPVHLLLATNHACWLVRGCWHRELLKALSYEQMNFLGIGFPREALRRILHTELTKATYRKRNGI